MNAEVKIAAAPQQAAPEKAKRPSVVDTFLKGCCLLYTSAYHPAYILPDRSHPRGNWQAAHTMQQQNHEQALVFPLSFLLQSSRFPDQLVCTSIIGIWKNQVKGCDTENSRPFFIHFQHFTNGRAAS